MSRELALSVFLASSFFWGSAPGAEAVVSPSGVDWSSRHVLALLSDDLGSGEYNLSLGGTLYGLNVPWSGTQWENVAGGLRGHVDVFGVQFPLTLYVVASYLEADFTIVTADSSQEFNEDFAGPTPGWEPLGAYPPDLSPERYVSPPTSAKFDTPEPSADGYARRWVPQCKEFKLTFWFNIDRLGDRTNLVSVSGPMGRSLGIEARAADGSLYLREGFWSEEVVAEIAPFSLDTWHEIAVRVAEGRVEVDLGNDGSLELSKPAAMLPALTTAAYVGDVSISHYSGAGYVDDLIFLRFDNEYPTSPVITPLDGKFPDVAAALRSNADILVVQSHGLTHANDVEVQRRYARGEVDDQGLPEANWWREFYDAVNDSVWGIDYQLVRVTETLDRLEDLFQHRPTVHVSAGNVFGFNTDTVLLSAGIHYHEARAYGAGGTSPYEPGVFWSSRTGTKELFYRQEDPNPELSAVHAVELVDSLFNAGAPAILNTHAFNALVGTDGTPLAVFYDVFLDSLMELYPDVVALTTYETAQLQETGRSIGLVRDDRLLVRNYLPTPYEFHVPIDLSYLVLRVERLGDGQEVAFRMEGPQVVFWSDEGDYRVVLRRVIPSDVPAERAHVGFPLRLRVEPNPARPGVALAAELPAPGPASLEVIDTRGRRVRELWRGEAPPGPLRLVWDGADEAGLPAASGVYFARLTWRGKPSQAKILLVR